MIDKIKELCIKYRELIVYFIVGVLTTAINWIASWLLKLVLDTDIVWQNFAVNAIAWLVAVVFSFGANRTFVFQSKSSEKMREFISFVSGRVGTGVLEIGIMALLVNVLNVNYWISKIFICCPIVLVLNYVISKFWVFKKGQQQQQQQ